MVSPTRLALAASKRGSLNTKTEKDPNEKSKIHKCYDVWSKEAGSMDDTMPRTNSPLQLLSSPVATPSRPVVIPTRSQSGKSRGNGRRPLAFGPNAESESHHASPLSPSMAALLAMTSLPRPAGLGARHRGRSSPSMISNVKGLESMEMEDSRSLLSSGSSRSWKMLHSPPEDSESDVWSLASDSTIPLAPSFRSYSMDSTSHLDADFESPHTTSYPATPASRPSRSVRPGRLNSLSSAERCEEHPLSPTAMQISIPTTPEPPLATSTSKPPSPQVSTRRSFTSNLTASLRALRAAAISRSSARSSPFEDTVPPKLTSPATLPTDPPSLLSMKLPYATEKRPALSKTVPDPALRRYLNPWAISPADLYSHTHAARSPDRITASIQLQSYSRVQGCSTSTNTGTSSSVGATSPPVFIPSARQEIEQRIRDETERAEAGGGLRQREARENGDFLRIVVLEMCMRRNGKLSEEQLGRARLWLPPRVEMKKEMDACSTPDGIPKRWRRWDLEDEAFIEV